MRGLWGGGGGGGVRESLLEFKMGELNVFYQLFRINKHLKNLLCRSLALLQWIKASLYDVGRQYSFHDIIFNRTYNGLAL